MAGLSFGDGEVPEDPKLPDDLQAKLDQYNRNFDAVNEFLGDDLLTDAGVATELRIEKTKEMLTEALPVAVRTLIQIATYGGSDNVRLKAATYLIDRCLGKEGNVSEEDEATKLLRRLQGTREEG